jgi:hypothetical protein
MKLNLVVLLSVAVLATSGHSQTSPPGSPTGPTTPGAGGTPPSTLNPGIGENSAEAQRRTQPAPGQVVPGQIAVTNTIAAETNQLIVTNLPPTSQPGFTNRIMATNGSLLMRDQALSEADRKLLVQIHTTVFGSSQPPAQLGGTSVHFILRDGAVRIVGFVPNADEQKRIVTLVQQVPGVVRVYDALQIGVAAAPGQTPVPTQTSTPQTPTPGQTPAPGQPR